jgi:hypothetical protein
MWGKGAELVCMYVCYGSTGLGQWAAIRDPWWLAVVGTPRVRGSFVPGYLPR